jgi:quercetin dioxygenase-like cupin family protein
MRKFKFSACAAVLLFATVMLQAHEEPAKTLKEKAEAAAYRQKIEKAGIRRIVTFEREIIEGKETGKKTKMMAQEFDKTGSILSLETYKDGGADARVEYIYDRGLNNSEQKTFKPTGKLLEERALSADGKVTSIIGHDFEYFEKEPTGKAPGDQQRLAHLGGEMRGGEVTSIAELSAHPERWFNKDVRIAGVIASAYTQEGSFIEVVPVAGPGEGILVSFADPGIKFPLECAGRSVVVEGMFYQKIYPAPRVAHWQEHSFRKGKPVPPFSLIKRLTARAADFGEMLSDIPVPGDIVAAYTARMDLSVTEFETTGFGTGRKVLGPGEVTEKHSTGSVREMIFCLEGEVTVHQEGSKAVTLRAGEMSFIPPATEHELKNDGTSRCVYLFVYSKAEKKTVEEKPHIH